MKKSLLLLAVGLMIVMIVSCGPPSTPHTSPPPLSPGFNQTKYEEKPLFFTTPEGTVKVEIWWRTNLALSRELVIQISREGDLVFSEAFVKANYSIGCEGFTFQLEDEVVWLIYPEDFILQD